MIDSTPNERAAALAGGKMGAEYLESIGATDLARLTPSQWEQFCLCVAGGYTETMAIFNEVPF